MRKRVLEIEQFWSTSQEEVESDISSTYLRPFILSAEQVVLCQRVNFQPGIIAYVLLHNIEATSGLLVEIKNHEIEVEANSKILVGTHQIELIFYVYTSNNGF